MGQWKTWVVIGAVLTSGCVEFWHKDHGIIQEAVERDRKENAPEVICPSAQEPRWFCPDASNPESCHWECRK